MTGTAAKTAVTTPRPTQSLSPKATPKPAATSTPASRDSTSENSNSDNSAAQSQTSARKINTLKLTSYKRKAKTIKGKSLKGAKVHVTIGSKSYTGKVSKNGTFKIKLSKKLKKGNTIKVYATKAGFSMSKTKSYTVR